MTVKQPTYTPSQGIRGSDPIINAVEDLTSLVKAPSLDNAMQAADSALGAAISVVGSMSSPIQALSSFAARLALEHARPLNIWMNQLTGDSAQVNGIGVSWQSVSQSLASVADELESTGQSTMADMSGASVSAYLMRQGQVVNAIRGVAGSSSTFGNAVVTVANLVKKVHDLICSIISDLVGIAVEAAVTAPATLGASLAKACKDIAAQALEWVSQVRNILTMIETAFIALKAMVDMVATALANLTSSIREVGKDCVEPGGGCCGGGASSPSSSTSQPPEAPPKLPKSQMPEPNPDAGKDKPSWWDILNKGADLYDKIKGYRDKHKPAEEPIKLPKVEGPKGPSSPWPKIDPPAIGILPDPKKPPRVMKTR